MRRGSWALSRRHTVLGSAKESLNEAISNEPLERKGLDIYKAHMSLRQGLCPNDEGDIILHHFHGTPP